MLYLLLLCPAAVLVMGLLTRLRPTAPVDRICSITDIRLDHQQYLLRQVAAQKDTLPRQRLDSRVGSAPANRRPELLAG